MKTLQKIKIADLFDVRYGHKLDLNKMTPRSREKGGISFVGRSSINNRISATVAPLGTINPTDAGAITVALGGTKLLASFVQLFPFYTAQNVAVLRPKEPLTFQQKVYAAMCIRENRFRYSAFGREANRTIKTIEIPHPDNAPNWLGTFNEKSSINLLSDPTQTVKPLNPTKWKLFALDQLFELRKGKRFTKAQMTPGSTPFIGAIDKNNGVSGWINATPDHTGNTITVNYNGSVGEAFYQRRPFSASDDVNVLYPRFKMSPSTGLFICVLIRQEIYRYSYGRKWHLERMNKTEILLPVTKIGNLDLAYMKAYMMSLRFGQRLTPLEALTTADS